MDVAPSRPRRRPPGSAEVVSVIPLVEGLGLVEALVALEADQGAARRAREGLGQLGLADPAGPSTNTGLESRWARKETSAAGSSAR